MEQSEMVRFVNASKVAVLENLKAAMETELADSATKDSKQTLDKKYHECVRLLYAVESVFDIMLKSDDFEKIREAL